MAQRDILAFLKRNKGWHTSSSLSKDLRQSQESVQRNLKQMQRFAKLYNVTFKIKVAPGKRRNKVFVRSK